MKYVITNDNDTSEDCSMDTITLYLMIIILVFGCVYLCHKFFGSNARYSTMIIIAILAFYLFGDCD